MYFSGGIVREKRLWESIVKINCRDVALLRLYGYVCTSVILGIF